MAHRLPRRPARRGLPDAPRSEGPSPSAHRSPLTAHSPPAGRPRPAGLLRNRRPSLGAPRRRADRTSRGWGPPPCYGKLKSSTHTAGAGQPSRESPVSLAGPCGAWGGRDVRFRRGAGHVRRRPGIPGVRSGGGRRVLRSVSAPPGEHVALCLGGWKGGGSGEGSDGPMERKGRGCDPL